LRKQEFYIGPGATSRRADRLLAKLYGAIDYRDALAVSAMVSGVLFERGPAVPFLTMAVLSVAVVLVVPVAWRSVPGRVERRAAVVTPPP